MVSRVRISLFLGICVVVCAQSHLVYGSEAQLLRQAISDSVYLQEVGEKIATHSSVTALAQAGGTLFAVAGGAVFAVDGGALHAAPGAPAAVNQLESIGGAVWALAESGVYRFDGQAWTQVSDLAFVDLCMHLGAVHGATRDDVFRYEDGGFVNIMPETGWLSNDSTVIMADGSQVLADPVKIGPIDAIDSYSGTLYLLRGSNIALLDGAVFRPEPIDWGMFMTDDLRDMMAFGNAMYITSNRGVSVLRGMALTTLAGDDGLPSEETTCLAQGFDRDLWIGTTTGAVRKVGDEYHYFGPDLWLPGNNVHDIAVGDREVYIATDGGIGIIRYEPYTLAKKADYYERMMDEWGFKRLGFVHKLYWDGKENEWLREISDNDGGHTAHYLAAMSFKYAATGDKEAREEALDAFEAMIWLDAITPKDGFIARAIWSETADKGKRSERGSGGLPAKWWPTEDGLFTWKGDTSSDEVNGHIYSVSVFHDLVAKGPEKDRAKQHIANIANHIMDNGWVLRDMDGQPTRWGRWDPEYLLEPYGISAAGLNGMEAQTYVITAHALTGDEKFTQGLKQLMDWGYHTYTVRQKLTFPPDYVVPWDDELAFRCYYPLLMYADDPYLRSIYLRSLTRHWEVMRMQKLPYFNFIYGALTGNNCEEEEAVQHLREWPLDCVNYSYHNSHRRDLAPESGYVPYGKGTRAMSPRETTAMWGSRSAIRYDGGSGGRGVTPPIGWLEDYWMGRYHGFIEAPTVKDKDLLAVPKSSGEQHGAKPYDGPPRPEGLIPER
ncbi:MAG: hypothetical protein AMXMBFR82_32620 [Candidatus Hydrogenedentota bacterium]